MMRRLLLAGVAILPLAAHGQTAPAFTGPGNRAAVQGDAVKLAEVTGSIAAKEDWSGPMGLVPDALKAAGDAGDDALSVQRAVTLACTTGTSRRMRLLARHYSMRSPVVQPCLLHWEGQGWQEQPVDANGSAGMSGTWLDFTAAAFGANGASNPVTITGAAAAGSVIQGIGLTQPVAMPAAGAATWTPASTPFLMAAETVNGGVEFRDIMCRGVDKCLSAHTSGRTSFRNIRGQVWRVLVKIDKSYDASRVDEIHHWPYFTTDQRVMDFQQANAVGVLTERNDTPLIGRVFVFGANAGVAFGNSANEGGNGGGTTTGAAIDVLSCDFTRHCLLGNADAPGVQVQIGQLRTYGQKWGADTQVPLRQGMLPGSDAIYVAGANGTVQVGNLENYGTDDATVRLDNAAPSNVQIGSAYLISTRMSAGATFAKLVGGAHTVTIGMPPMITPDVPAGWALSNGGASGALSWPDAARRN